MKKLLICVTALFIIAMTVLTFTARDIHNSTLPHVTAKRLSQVAFNDYSRTLAIPKEIIDNGDVFIIGTRIINGEKRNVAQKVTLTLGLENDDYYEVIGGIIGNELIIFSTDRELENGDEVFVE